MRTSLIIALAGISVLAAGCNNGAVGLPPVVHPKYQQIERLSRPAIKELFEAFGNHDQTNRSAPTNDTALQNAIATFLGSPGSGGVANRSAATSAFIQAVLIPDEIKADLSQVVGGCGGANAPCAAYLGVETGGATGSKFGGRWLNDDTIKTSLGIVFGNTVAALGGAPDDGNESWCLTDDNL